MEKSSSKLPAEAEVGPLNLAALRGEFGEWAYYVAMMPLVELQRRVHFAEEIHKDKRLAEMMQRRVKATRGKEVARYLETAKERFFNSLVVAVYKGQPRWHEMTLRNAKDSSISVGDVDPRVRGSLGILSLDGKERLFALDGQHRLAGIRIALDEKKVPETDEVAVVCVGHSPDPAGLERTRRLFTTLNKKAKPVRLADIIALDEDDLGAICARRLVDELPMFMGERVAIKPNNNISDSDTEAITTIGALFEVAWFLIRKLRPDVEKMYGVNRPPEDVVNQVYALVVEFFDALIESRHEVRSFSKSKKPSEVVAKYRNSHALFRPVGLAIFADVVARHAARNAVGVGDAVRRLARLPLLLAQPPFGGLLWDPRRGTVQSKQRAFVRDLLAYMAGEKISRSEKELQSAIDERSIGLPFNVLDLDRL